MIDTSGLKKGVCIQYKGAPMIVQHVTTSTPTARGGNTITKTKLRNLISGQILNESFRGGEKFDEVDMSYHDASFMYADGTDWHFMDNETFEQLSMTAEDLEAEAPYLLPNTDVQINFHNDNPIGVELPASVILEVVETEGVVKGQTASGSGKPAVLETGHKVTVPTFVNVGEKVKVNTDTGEYMERA